MFCAWPGVTLGPDGGRYDIAKRLWRVGQHEVPEQDAWNRCRDGLVECTRWAAEHGVTLALQNHPPVLDDHRDMLRMIAEVGSPSLKACFDAPLAYMQGVTAMRETSNEIPRGLQVLSHFGGEYDRTPDGGIDAVVWNWDGSRTPEHFYADFLRGMTDIGYEGYIGYELCHPLPLVDGQPAGIDFVDKNARLAAEYMKMLIADVAAESVVSAAKR
jgi:sugar phosphate isomerase/epimerase